MSHTNPEDAQQDNSIRLKAGIRFVPERSESGWHCVLEDTSTKRFFRIGRREYLIASCLQRAKTPVEIGKLLNDTQPDLDIQAAEIEQAIRWLINVGLVVSGNASNQDNAGKSGPPSQPTTAGSWIDPFMMRFTLISGDSLERWLRPLLFLVSFPLIVTATCLILLAGILFICNYSDLMGLSSKLFVPSAAGWWLIAWLVMKAFHELGHALVCMGHGGEVRGAGVGIFYFAPVPYVDTTDMWRLSSRKARAFCALGGIWFELTIAAIAILVCQATENSSLQYFCVSLATMGTFTTLAFNANPLAKFDGYFVLSDLLNRPNLWTEAQQALRSAIKDGSTLNRHSPKAFQSFMLTTYGALASLYRYTMMLAIGWGAWLTYRGVGLGMISLAVYLWFIAPWLKGRQLRRSQQMLATSSVNRSPFWRSPKNVKRFALISGVAVGCLAILFVPSPWQPAAPGMWFSKNQSRCVRKRRES